jgi:hypothetical protein
MDQQVKRTDFAASDTGRETVRFCAGRNVVLPPAVLGLSKSAHSTAVFEQLAAAGRLMCQALSVAVLGLFFIALEQIPN